MVLQSPHKTKTSVSSVRWIRSLSCCLPTQIYFRPSTRTRVWNWRKHTARLDLTRHVVLKSRDHNNDVTPPGALLPPDERRRTNGRHFEKRRASHVSTTEN